MTDMTDEQILELIKLAPELMASIIKGRGEIIECFRKELERLKKYEMMVHFIANDYYELSHDKVQAIYADYKKRCRKLIEEDDKHD